MPGPCSREPVAPLQLGTPRSLHRLTSPPWWWDYGSHFRLNETEALESELLVSLKVGLCSGWGQQLLPCHSDNGISMMGAVAPGCPNKLPQTRWLKTADIYALTVQEARDVHNHSTGRASSFQKSLCQASPPPLAPGKHWCPLACNCVALVSTCVSTGPSPWVPLVCLSSYRI